MKHPFIEDAQVKLRDQDHIIFGEVFLKLQGQSSITTKQLTILVKQLCKLDWRLKDLVLTIQNKTLV